MNAERWQQISRIFNSAISLDSAERAAYVKEKCGKDRDLREEVERLIESHEQAEDKDFIAGLAVEDVAEHFIDAEETRALHKGQQFGAYWILDHLGTGGMGEVYLAKDSRLDRTVALKILTSDLAADQRRMQRFRQEAKVASSLNQPNILTIYEFGEVDQLTFLAAEYVDGDTLRDYLREKRLKLGEILEISIQMLAALDAAHEAKIVHRDMKPENVMIRRRDHVVKVLDFGLAKVTQKTSTLSGFSSGDAATEFKTAPGLIMGTVNYMSPEQAQGKAVDARSDIWSTGIIIYEMVAGTKPFGGTTSAHTIVQILEQEPAPLTHDGTMGVPAELQRIVSKSIAKDPDERYQTAKDMLIDLRNLKKRLELDAQIEREPARGTQPAKSKAGLVIALTAVFLVIAGIVAVNAWRKSGNTQIVQPLTPASPAVERSLTYWITVQKFRDGRPYQKPFDLPADINFEKDYQIRLSVRSPQSGHLYVLNEGPANDAAPEFVVLFPSPTANAGSAVVTENEPLQIPEQTWMRFDEEQGVEKLWLVFAEQPVAELEAAKRFVNRENRGLVPDPAQNQSIQNYLNANSAVTPSVAKDAAQTTLKTTQKILVYPVSLQHH